MIYGHQLMKFAFVWLFAIASQACRCGSSAENIPSDTPQSSPSMEERVSAIKDEILTKLGMSDVPDLEKMKPNNETERQEIVQLYERTHRQLSSKTHNISTVGEEYAKQFYTFKAERSSDKFFQRTKQIKRFHVYFNLTIRQSTDRDKWLKVTEARLKLFTNRKYLRMLKRKDESVHLKIYQLISHKSQPLGLNEYSNERTRNRTKGANRVTSGKISRRNHRSDSKRRKSEQHLRKRLIHSRVLSKSSSTAFEEFNILESVSKWISDNSSNHGLLITVESQNHRLLDVIRANRKQQTSTGKVSSRTSTPELNVFVQETVRPTRQRRSIEEPSDCQTGDGENRCCRFSKWISFADIGWSDWIIAPDGYLARFCDGACPLHYKVANRFTSIKELLKVRRPSGGAAPPTCCTATRMSSLPIAHYNREGVAVISIFEDMIVDECKCT